MIKVIHIISGLKTGGAEMMLYKLLSMSDAKLKHSVVALRNDINSPISKKISSLHIDVSHLNFSKSRLNLNKIIKLRDIIRTQEPDVIQGWMYHGNVAATLTNIRTSNAPILWNVRHSLHDIKKEKFSTRQVIQLNKLLSRLPAKIIYNSKTSAQQHRKLGFNPKNEVILPNGFDTDLFKPNLLARNKIREQYNIENSDIVIGLVGRYHPVKGHNVFFQAAKQLLQQINNAYFFVVGEGASSSNPAINKEIEGLNIKHNVVLLGEQENIHELTCAFDIATSSSIWSEGFSNTIGEAMSCEIPCVATDVGDSKWIISDTGIIIPPNSPNALCNAWYELISLKQAERQKLGLKARNRIVENFKIDEVAERYHQLYKSVL